MKRRHLLRHLRGNGCELLREGGDYSDEEIRNLSERVLEAVETAVLERPICVTNG